ncbi:ubiquitin carboxyl-terminal hydrolase 14-like [Tigriopus californicus]|uniref:ubiquitin carboxyl-terminal hydrolase 14-like n=1 Tax=Tigriopus californicus TaxID=6832 RepID=UPI0027DA33B0|nr:ubiquitin carboxyl-terminal hydrolase 14-like [Tigriopus californicus]
MPQFQVKVKWSKELFPDVQVNTDEEPLVLKAQIFALTGVEPHRQKIMLKGATIKDDTTWGANVLKGLKDGATLLLMGSKEEDIPTQPVEKTKFVEDMDESEIQSALAMPAGLQNLGNTCYMNATVQCLKTVPEFKTALNKYSESVSFNSDVTTHPQSITASLRDLMNTMDKGQTLPPLVLLQVLHRAFPNFAEKSEHGGYQQQDANECWVEIMNMVKQKLPSEDNAKFSSAVDQYFGLVFDTEIKCIESEDEPVTKSQERFLQYNCYIDKDVKFLASGLKNRLQESMNKHSTFLDRDAEYVKTLKVSRLPGYLTVQMVRFQYKQRDAVNAKILKDIKFPLLLDTFELCSEELQQKLVPMRKKFKDYEDKIVLEGDKKKGLGKEASLKKGREESEDMACEPYDFSEDPGSNNSGYYELQAVLTHKGRSSNSGHYVAWVKQKGDTWMECNDDDIRPIHVDDVLKLSGGGDWHTAYLLLYGPRKLPISEEDKTKSEEETAKSAGETADKPMETN